jgi:homoserine dehydrogenase
MLDRLSETKDLFETLVILERAAVRRQERLRALVRSLIKDDGFNRTELATQLGLSVRTIVHLLSEDARSDHLEQLRLLPPLVTAQPLVLPDEDATVSPADRPGAKA